ncbi:MAG TPA: glycosyltransferase [Planctomycetota bacterium]|nr:glycosyltransferase [Planctomycetota bacterium]
MRVLYHHRTASDDGQAVHIREMQAAFRRAGHELQEVALVRRGGGGRPSALGAMWGRAPGFVREIAEHGYNLAGLRALTRAIADFRPDVLYERYALSTTCGSDAAARAGVPFVLEVNSPLADEVERTRGLSFPGLARRAERRTLGKAAVVAVVSGALREWAAGLGVDRGRLVWTPNGVDLARFAPGPKRPDLLRSFDLEGRTVVGFTGFVREWHRLDLAIDAIAPLADRGVALLVVGDGPALADLRDRARALGVERAVRFAGKVSHEAIPDHVRLFDVAIVPAINPYASPLKLFEYLAAEIASVVVDQPNLREVLDDGAARFVPAGDAAALRSAIGELADDPAKRRALAAAGRRCLLERDYTWDANVRRVLDALAARTSAATVGARR